MAQILSGREVAASMQQQQLLRVAQLEARGVIPCLGILRVGSRSDDLSYERGVEKKAAALGIAVKKYLLPENADTEAVLFAIAACNADPAVHGLLLLQPLPEHIDNKRVRNALTLKKDADGVTDASLSGLFLGDSTVFSPCTAEACLTMLDHYGIDCAGKHVVVIGRSMVVGKPLAMLLLARNATVTVCHSKTENLAALCQSADILIAAAGRARMVTESFVRPGQIVLDVGVNFTPTGEMTGDVAFDSVSPVVSAITPVPGGVGAVTTSVLLEHVLNAAEQAE